ncbi:MAG: long-chain-fatty-acid--CoA ligase [Sciscionella sp.]
MTVTAQGNVADILSEGAKRCPDATAIVFEAAKYDWVTLRGRARRAATALRELGLQPGDRFAHLGKNHAATVELIFAAAITGTVIVIVNSRLAVAEVSYIFRDAQAKAVFATGEFRDTATEAARRAELMGPVLASGGDSYEYWLAAAEPSSAAHHSTPENCFLQLYTSGTTGKPKGAMLTHRSMLSHTIAAQQVFDHFTPGDVNLVAMPLFHVSGVAWLLAGMYGHARSVLIPDVVPATVLRLCEQQRVTHTFVVPAVLRFLLADAAFDSTDLSNMKVLAYGGSSTPNVLLAQALQRFPATTGFYHVYGMTEASGAASTLGPAEHRDRPGLIGSIGKPMTGVRIRVVEPDTGEDVKEGESGELWIHSADLMTGYWQQPEATEQTLVDGWYRSGDVGYRDDEGYYFLRDRLADMIISGGENVYPVEVEQVLTEHPSVTEAAVVGAPDDTWGQVVHAVVAGEGIDPGALMTFCRERLASYKCPRAVRVVDALPRNATGKILRRQLRQ